MYTNVQTLLRPQPLQLLGSPAAGADSLFQAYIKAPPCLALKALSLLHPFSCCLQLWMTRSSKNLQSLHCSSVIIKLLLTSACFMTYNTMLFLGQLFGPGSYKC